MYYSNAPSIPTHSWVYSAVCLISGHGWLYLWILTDFSVDSDCIHKLYLIRLTPINAYVCDVTYQIFTCRHANLWLKFLHISGEWTIGFWNIARLWFVIPIFFLTIHQILIIANNSGYTVCSLHGSSTSCTVSPPFYRRKIQSAPYCLVSFYETLVFLFGHIQMGKCMSYRDRWWIRVSLLTYRQAFIQG